MKNFEIGHKHEIPPKDLREVIGIIEKFWQGKEYATIGRDENILEFSIVTPTRLSAIDLKQEIINLGLPAEIKDGYKVCFLGEFSNQDIEKFSDRIDILESVGQ